MGRFRALLTLTVAVAAGCNTTTSVPEPGPAPGQRAIKHVVILLQENRSLNNMFAGFPGADTALEGDCINTPWCKNGKIQLRPVTLETTGQLGFGTDIDHSHHGFEIEYNHGRMDGFDKIRYGQAGTGPPAEAYPYRFVERSESKAYWDFAKRFTLGDHMFVTDTASSFLSHQQIIAGTVRLNAHESLTDQPSEQPWGCDAPPGTVTAVIKTDRTVEEFGGPFPCLTQYGTMADILDAANLPWKYYVHEVNGAELSGQVWNAFDAIRKVRYGPQWKTNFGVPSTFFTDVSSGSLGAVSWVIPSLADSDHPASGCNHGPRWVTSVVNAIGESKYWDSTAVIVLWDDWGGWYDNVKPPQINYTSLGFRVPMLVISPFAKPHFVSHTLYDFGSVLKFVEQNFGTGTLGTTDETSTSIVDSFDFTQHASTYQPEPLPAIKPCVGNPDAQEILEHDPGAAD